MADFIWVDEASRCFEFTDGEDVQFFSDKPAFIKTWPAIYWYISGNAVKAAVFPVKRRYCRYFSVLTPLFFQLNAVNAAIFPVKRR